MHTICNLKYSVPKENHNGSNCDYHFIIKELTKKNKKRFTCSEENTEKYITFTVTREKKLKELITMEKKLQKIYLRYYILLIVQDYDKPIIKSCH